MPRFIPDEFAARRHFLKQCGDGACAAATVSGMTLFAGCGSGGLTFGDAGEGRLDVAWGRQGSSPGRLAKPRAITIDGQDRLYIVDFTPRISVFTGDGKYLHGWQPPEFANGRPTGLWIDGDGNLLVSDTHYYRVLTYTPQGELLPERTIGGVQGTRPGEFNWVTHCIQDAQGNFYISEFGDLHRIQKFSPDRKFIFQWGTKGTEPGNFDCPRKMAIDADGLLWMADACNHRVQVFDVSGASARLVTLWGEEGTAPGQLRYPYDLLLDGQGHVYVCEFGNHRVQKFTREGRLLGWFGTSGRGAGELDQPWGITRDSRGRMYVLDSYNHRVQRFWL